MTQLIGWIFISASIIWFGLVPFAGAEPPLHQTIGNAVLLIAGAILARR